MPDGDMTTNSMVHRLRRSVLVVVLAGLAGCAGPRNSAVSDSAAKTTGMSPDASASTASAQGRSSAASAQASAGGSADSADSSGRKPDAAQIVRGTEVLIKPGRAEQPSSEPADVSLNFDAADIREIAKLVLADILGESYVVDPKAQGTISFRTTRPLPRSALLPTLETVLRMNGIALVKENGIFKIIPAAAVRGSVSPRTGGAFAGFTVQIVPLKFISAREMTKILEPFAPDASAVKTDEVRNLLILSGTQNEIGHMLDAVDMFDVDWLSGMSVGVFTLQSTDVRTLDADLKKVLGDANLNPLAGMVRFFPIERLNAYIIITPQPRYLDQAKVWLERLDRAGGNAGGARLFVYHVQNGKAEHLAGLLTQTFGGRRTTTAPTTPAPSLAPGLAPATIASSGTPGTAPGSAAAQRPAIAASAPAAGTTLTVTDESGGAASEVRVTADKENNALLILATPAGYEKIESALRKLDTPPRQVLIEVTIAEVTLKDELQYGVEWLFTNGARNRGQLDMGNPGLNRLVPGFSWTHMSTAGDAIQAVLTALASNNKLNILSSPHIMVADNQQAKIQVGDSVPTQGPQSVTGTGVVVNSVQYLDTGVILTVTPHINAGGMVNLEVNQEISIASSTTTSQLNSPTISKRSAKTVVTVQSGETMVMGGLILENGASGTSGLPFLSTIPVLGGLFGTQSVNNSKTELILMITPRVANNLGQTKAITDEFRKKMKEAEALLDCGISNAVGFTTRRGLWCQHPPFFGSDQTGNPPGQ